MPAHTTAWIWNPWKDFGLLHGAGVLAFAFVWLVPLSSTASLALIVVLVAVFDIGHMYVTVWRTYFRRKEFERDQRYLWVPLVCFMGTALWASFRIPYLFTFVLYATIYHHMRQYYGVTRWYEKLNDRPDPYAKFFIYSLFFLPLLFAHFKPGGIQSIFNPGDLLTYPNPTLFRGLVGVYLLVVAAWVAHEVTLWVKGTREINRVLTIFVPMFFTGFGAYFGTSTIQVVLPLVCTHGLAYFALMIHAMRRVEPERYPSLWVPTCLILGTAILCGGTVAWLDEAYLETAYTLDTLSTGQLLLIGEF